MIESGGVSEKAADLILGDESLQPAARSLVQGKAGVRLEAQHALRVERVEVADLCTQRTR